MGSKMTAEDVHEAMRKRWPSDAYALLFQVANGTGSRKTRTADALVFSLWPSRGLDVEGVEVKVSRSDWRKEIEDPGKASTFFRHCHRWWIAAPPGIVESGELPPKWGLLELKRGVLRQVVEAPRDPEPEPIGRPMLAAIMRNVQQVEVAAVMRQRQEIERSAEARADKHVRQQLESLTEAVQQFKDSTGIDVRFGWGNEALAEALRLVEEGKTYRHLLRSVGNLGLSLRRTADEIDAALESSDGEGET